VVCGGIFEATEITSAPKVMPLIQALFAITEDGTS